MKIKVLVHVRKDDIGTLSDLRVGEIVLVEDSVGEALVEAGKAEEELF